MAHPQETRDRLRRSYIFGQMSLEIASAQAGVAFATAAAGKRMHRTRETTGTNCVRPTCSQVADWRRLVARC